MQQILHNPLELPDDLPVPVDDGAADHLTGLVLPDIALAATDGARVNLSRLSGRTVVYIYPRTGRPGQAMPIGWNGIPGARGCTPQSCSFRDHFDDALQRALQLPTFEVDGMVLLKRMALVIDDGVTSKVFYPVFPPDRSAAEVVAWLRGASR